MKPRTFLTLAVIFYIALISAVVWAMFSARASMVAAYDTPQEQAHWDELAGELDRRHHQREAFRVEVAEATKQPVAPAPPKARSARPPTLELLENHFAACLATTIAGVTLLYAVLTAMLLGAIFRPGRRFTP